MFCTLSIKDTIIDKHCCDNDWALLTNSYLRPIHSLPAVNPICASLGPDTSREMPRFIALLVVSFEGKGKKSTWEAWKSYREVTDAFLFADNPY